MSKAVFVDTSAWIMLLNSSEKFHENAASIYKSELKGSLLLTTNLVVSETYTWLRKKAGFGPAFNFLSSLNRKKCLGQINIIYSDAVLEKEASDILEKYKDHPFSYVDAVSFAAMEKMSVKKSFAYDRHFLVAGFELINRL